MPCIVYVGVNFEFKFDPNSSRPVKPQTSKSNLFWIHLLKHFSRGLATTKVDFDPLSKMTLRKNTAPPSAHAPYFFKNIQLISSLRLPQKEKYSKSTINESLSLHFLLFFYSQKSQLIFTIFLKSWRMRILSARIFLSFLAGKLD